MFTLLGREWVKISKTMALSLYPIGECQFRNNIAAPDATDFHASDLKQYIEDWFNNQLALNGNAATPPAASAAVPVVFPAAPMPQPQSNAGTITLKDFAMGMQFDINCDICVYLCTKAQQWDNGGRLIYDSRKDHKIDPQYYSKQVVYVTIDIKHFTLVIEVRDK